MEIKFIHNLLKKAIRVDLLQKFKKLKMNCFLIFTKQEEVVMKMVLKLREYSEKHLLKKEEVKIIVHSVKQFITIIIISF